MTQNDAGEPGEASYEGPPGVSNYLSDSGWDRSQPLSPREGGSYESMGTDCLDPASEFEGGLLGQLSPTVFKDLPPMILGAQLARDVAQALPGLRTAFEWGHVEAPRREVTRYLRSDQRLQNLLDGEGGTKLAEAYSMTQSKTVLALRMKLPTVFNRGTTNNAGPTSPTEQAEETSNTLETPYMAFMPEGTPPPSTTHAAQEEAAMWQPPQYSTETAHHHHNNPDTENHRRGNKGLRGLMRKVSSALTLFPDRDPSLKTALRLREERVQSAQEQRCEVSNGGRRKSAGVNVVEQKAQPGMKRGHSELNLDLRSQLTRLYVQRDQAMRGGRRGQKSIPLEALDAHIALVEARMAETQAHLHAHTHTHTQLETNTHTQDGGEIPTHTHSHTGADRYTDMENVVDDAFHVSLYEESKVQPLMVESRDGWQLLGDEWE